MKIDTKTLIQFETSCAVRVFLQREKCLSLTLCFKRKVILDTLCNLIHIAWAKGKENLFEMNQ